MSWASHYILAIALRVTKVNLRQLHSTIEQVAGVQLVQGQTITSLADAQVSLPHRISNIGNVSDRFDIQLTNATGDDYDLAGLVLY